jgi:HPt (histidine-containing phosphotransfer) domain-containing protein
MSDPTPQSNPFGAGEDPLANDPELRKELAAMFVEDGPGQLAQVRMALEKRDAPSLKLAAHTLKGSVGVFKDQAAYDAALRMEHAGRDADWPTADSTWQDLNREFDRLLKVVAEIAGRAESPAAGGRS